MAQEERFALSLAQLEEERLKNTHKSYNISNYCQEEFSLNIEEKNASNKVYHLLQQIWQEGILELFIRNNILTNKLEVKDLVAFDSSRFTKLVIEVLKLKLIKEQEAWGLLFLNAQRVQDTFKDAATFKTSYLKGALFYDILFKSDEARRAEKIEHFDTLLETLQQNSTIELFWLDEDIFKNFNIETNQRKTESSTIEIDELWHYLDNLTANERNQVLPKLYEQKRFSAETYLELPALYPNTSYAYYLRGTYFYHFAWEARGLGITNRVGQKNYALFYERLRYARDDLKKAYVLAPNEQSYWGELYNLLKHFRNRESDQLEEELLERIRADAMQNPFCVQRVAHMKKERWGGSHEESLTWAREVVAHSQYGDAIKIILFETLIEQYHYIVEYDRDEKRANAIFEDRALQQELNQYFDELVVHKELHPTLRFWYEKVGEKKALAQLQ